MPLEGITKDPQPARKRVSDILELLKPIDLEGDDLTRLILSLEEEMHEAAKELRFEYAARLRDEVNELKRELREVAEAG